MKKQELHDIKTLPKWAQKHINNLNYDINKLQNKMEAIQNMNAIMCEPKRDWFTLPFSFKDEKPVHLWLLNYDQPFSVCSLSKGDLIFVGRAKKEQVDATK
ncbi:MAG: hypothetical protein WC389_16955 [Lutibacter sp.]